MAYKRITKNSTWTSLGQKVRTGVEIGSAIKTAWDVGRTIYTGVQTALPYIATAAALIP
jgi:hypothetical protein